MDATATAEALSSAPKSSAPLNKCPILDETMLATS